MSWTQEQDAALIELWGEGYSGDEIARRLKITRNAVLGRADRLRRKGAPIKSRASIATVRRVRALRNARHRPSVPACAPRANSGRAAPLRRPLRVLEALPSPTVILKAGEVEPNGTPAGLLELCAAACRWPVSSAPPHMFCNKIRRGGSPYCDEHTLKSFAPKREPAA